MQKRLACRGFRNWVPTVCIALVLLLAVLLRGALAPRATYAAPLALGTPPGGADTQSLERLRAALKGLALQEINVRSFISGLCPGTQGWDLSFADADVNALAAGGEITNVHIDLLPNGQQCAVKLYQQTPFCQPAKNVYGETDYFKPTCYDFDGQTATVQAAMAHTVGSQTGIPYLIGIANGMFNCGMVYTEVSAWKYAAYPETPGADPWGPIKNLAELQIPRTQKWMEKLATAVNSAGLCTLGTDDSNVLIKSVSGDPTFLDAVVIRGSQEITATAGMKIYDSDRVRTGYKSEMVLSFLDGGTKQERVTVVVDPLSEYKIAVFFLGDVAHMELWLKIGGISANVLREKLQPTRFTVKTPTLTASVRGTIFRVYHDEEKATSTVSVSEGTVLITPTNTALVAFELNAGQQVLVSPSHVGEIAAYSPSQAEQPIGNPTAIPATLVVASLGLLAVVVVALMTMFVVFATRPRAGPARPIAPPPERLPTRMPRPSDLPERGAPRKPTDLPR
jgi:hypothetical protein